MTTTNPLDRIRSLAPADMTDDELGVAVLLEIGCKYVTTRQFEDAGFVGHLSRSPGHSFYPPLLHGPECSPVWQDANPAEYYDSLLPIVREWVGRNRRRLRSFTRRIQHVADFRLNRGDIAHIDDGDADMLNLLSNTPRQLAEAFVTAARSVQ